MLETKHEFTGTDQKTIGKVVDDTNVAINHMVLPKGEALPEHNANSNAYMIVVRGQLTLKLEGREEHIYPAGSVVAVPYGMRMHPQNKNDEVLEIIVVKAPSPRTMKQQRGGECGCR